MFKLEPLNTEIEAKTLPLSDRLFHEALREAPESAARFTSIMTGARTLTSSTGTTRTT